jgi:peroxiredoxin
MLSLLATVALAQEAGGGKEAKPQGAEIGKDAPAFELKSADGKTVKLSDYKDKVVVLEWLSKDCPVSNHEKGCGKKMKALAEKYQTKGVVWLGLDSSANRKADEVVTYISEHQIPYPILLDPDGKVGHAYGARTTPHMFIINKGKLVYSGAHDDKKARDYVSESLDAILGGKDVPSPKTESYGCSIKYAKP